MKKLLLIASLAMLALPSALYAYDRAQPSSDAVQAKKQLIRTYARIAKMRRLKDVQGLTQFIRTGATLDFKVQLRNHKIVGLRDVLRQLPQRVQIPGTIKSFAYQVGDVRRTHNAAIAHVTVTYSGTNLVNGRAHRFAGKEIWDDVWTMNWKGIWILKYMMQGPSTFTVDGKPVASGPE